MPGITGIIGSAGANAADIVSMTRRLIHEPFYVSGTYVCEEMDIYLGWTAHPNSYSAGMPFWNRTRDVLLLFSGEHFGDASDHVQSPGEGTHGNPSANDLLSRYDAMGIEFLKQLNGWFSGILIDLRQKQAWLFNDRYGLGRLYYYVDKGCFYFSSEAKSLLEVLPRTRELDPRSVAEIVACGSVMQDRTLFRDVSLIPGGAQWRFGKEGNYTKESFFTREVWEQQSPLEADEFYRQLKETMARIVPRYLVGPSQVAMSLTGGIDGRMILASTPIQKNALPCFTFGGPYRDCADVVIARQLAALCEQVHETITLDRDFFQSFPELAAKSVFISDGAMDVTGSVELYMNRRARQIAPIRLTGNYGSEVVRGNVAFRPAKVAPDVFHSDFADLIVAADKTYQAERAVPVQSFVAFKQAPWHHYARLAIEQSQLTLRSPYFDNDLVGLMYRVPTNLLSSSELSLRLIKDFFPAMAAIPTDRGEVYGDVSRLREFRKTLIDFTVKAEYAYDYGMPQSVARLDHVLAPLHLERLFLGRHKFYHFRVWYRDELAKYVREILLDPRSLQRPYVKKSVLERMVMAHTDGKENWTREIHRMLTLELLQRQLIEQ